MATPLTARGRMQAAIDDAQAAYFVGRRRELETLEQLLDAGRYPRLVLMHGPGGIGKSCLLGQFGRLAAARDLPFKPLDARLLPQTPQTVRQAVEAALSDTDGTPEAPAILAIDHVEHLSALCNWLRVELLPDLPLNTVLLLVGRNRPEPQWYADPGLQPYVVDLELKPLADRDADEYLRRKGLANELRDRVRAFSRGHPLTLALTADHLVRQHARDFDAASCPDLVHTLVDWLLSDIDDPQKLTALQACATVRRIDARLLEAMLAHGDDADAIYAWLADQHVVERQSGGLVIHDLVRELIIRDLRARDIGRHHQLIRRATGCLLAGLEREPESVVHARIADATYALRHEPHIRRHFPFDDNNYYPDRAHPDEWPMLAEEVERLEGGESRAWFEHWLQTNPDGLTIFRDKSRVAVAVALIVTFPAEALSSGHDDPAVDRLFGYLRDHAPLRPGENALLLRHWLAHGTHQARTPVWAHLAVIGNSLVLTPGATVVALVCDTAYDWSGIAENADTPFLPGTGFTSGGREFMLIGHDARRESPLEWARNTVERVLHDGAGRALAPEDTVILGKPDFEQAVRQALRRFHDNKALNENPLLSTPLLRRNVQQRSAQALRHFLERASEQFLGGADTRSPHAILSRAYFQAGTKLAAAAVDLHVSERTFRRRLREAEAQLVEALWEMETNA